MEILTETSSLIEFENWGLIDYSEALKRQLDQVEEVARTQSLGRIIFCTHPPVVTTGRATRPSDVYSWSGPVIEVSRGGRATYHGPNQIVIYPILNLNIPRKGRGPREIQGFLRDFEDALVSSLARINITAVGKSLQKKSPEHSETPETGVWVQGRKIASLGVAVRQWISHHGAALNWNRDPMAFQGLRPCGFSSETMINAEDLISQLPSREEMISILKEELQLKL